MKIQAIKKLCMAGQYCRILTGQQGQQWIGGRAWMARVDEGLRIDADAIPGLFDLSDEQNGKLTIEEAQLETADLWPVLRRTMVQLKEAPFRLKSGGEDIIILGLNGVAYLLNQRYVRAAVDNADYREYMLAWDQWDNPLIIVNDGMIFAGVVKPYSKETAEKALAELEAVGSCLAGGWIAREEDYQLKLEAETGKQLNMDDFDVADEQ